jgi:hypothetical protein
LISTGAQLVAAQPDPAVSAALGEPGILLTNVIRTMMDGYGDRPRSKYPVPLATSQEPTPPPG